MTVKKFESPSISGEDMDKNFWLTFGQPCRRMCKRKTLFAPQWNSLPLFVRTADSFTSFRRTYVADQDIYSQDICSRSAVCASGTLTRTSRIINSLLTCLLLEFRVSARQHDLLCSDVMWPSACDWQLLRLCRSSRSLSLRCRKPKVVWSSRCVRRLEFTKGLSWWPAVAQPTPTFIVFSVRPSVCLSVSLVLNVPICLSEISAVSNAAKRPTVPHGQ